MNTLKPTARHTVLACLLALLLQGLAGCSQTEMLRLYFANSGTQARLDQPLPLRIPFREHEGWVLVKASINGAPPLDFVLDTGAGMLTVLTGPKTGSLPFDMRLVRRIGGDGVAGITAAVQQDLDIDFGPVTLLGQTALAVPLDTVLCDESIQEPPFQGVIGHELFHRYVVEIDHARSEVVLHDPDTYRYTGNGHVVPLDISSRHAYAKARVHGPEGADYEARLHVDSGAGIFLSLFPQTHEAIEVPAGGEEAVACFVGGLARYQTGSSVTLGLGDAPGVETPVRYSLGDEIIDTGQHGRIGARYLARFNVVYDFPGERMFLSPRTAGGQAGP